MCGDPPNIIVGTSLQLTFADFITNTGVLAGISLILVVIYYYLIFHKELRVKRTGKVVAEYPDPKSAITNKTSFAISTVISVCSCTSCNTCTDRTYGSDDWSWNCNRYTDYIR